MYIKHLARVNTQIKLLSSKIPHKSVKNVEKT